MIEVLIDSDVLIDHLRGARALPEDLGPAGYSSLTRVELYAGQHANELLIDELVRPFDEVEVDRHVAELAGRIRRATGLETVDACIAATAIISECELLTRNVRDFSRVKGLRLRPS